MAWALRMPVVPLRMAGRHYRGPGFRLLVNWCRLVDLGASETGNLVCEVLDESERALLWFAHRVGALPERPPGDRRRPIRSPDAESAEPTGETPRPDRASPTVTGAAEPAEATLTSRRAPARRQARGRW